MSAARAVLGYDPGVNGGLVVLDAAGGVAFCRGLNDKMGENESLEVAWAAASALLKAGGWEGYAEKVGHMSGDGGKGSHTFGYTKGLVRGALRTRGVTLYNVPPQLWQAKLSCMTGGQKNVSKRRAAELFPEVKVTHKVGDALLIALYGRLMTPA